MNAFYTQYWCYQNCSIALHNNFNNHSNRSLTKSFKKLNKGAITNDHSNSSSSPSRPRIQRYYYREIKKPHFSQKKLRYSTETKLINNFDKKSQFRFDCKKNTTFCEHHKYNNLSRIFNQMILQIDHFLWKILQKPQIDWTLFLNTTSFRSCFKPGTFSITQQNENKTTYECKKKLTGKQNEHKQSIVDKSANSI